MRHLRALTLLAATLAACGSDDELQGPDLTNNGRLLERYVAIGNSITAGFQSDGINDSTQHEAYPVLVARAAGATFFVPALVGRGCPPPLTNNVTLERVGGGTNRVVCDLRATPAPPLVNNVAVPGAQVIDAVTNTGPGAGPNVLTQFILGGRTQAEAMAAARPTFVSVWLGNNDVLGALTETPSADNPGGNPGNPARITPQADFEAAYDELIARVEETGAPAVLFGVADVTTIPYASSGALYWCLDTGLCPGVEAAGFPPGFTVEASCAPAALGGVGDETLVPWTVGIARLLEASAGVSRSLDCANDAEVVTAAEIEALRAATEGFNAYIRARADERGWAYVDVNPALRALKEQGVIPAFPDLSAAETAGVRFGPLFSLDGVHPSGAAHRIVADSMIAAVNRTYGTAIPFVGP